jgi:hypothetical protein
MKSWWRRWTYEMPLALGDALWEVCVVQFADFLSRLTMRKVLEFLVIAILVMAFVQTLPIDLAILFAGDTLTYLEILLALRLTAGKGALKAVWLLAVRFAASVSRAVTVVISHCSARIGKPRRRRERGPRRHNPHGRRDDEPAMAWGALSPA